MAIGRLCGGAGEIPASQHLTRFYRRLAERIDAQKMSRENGFQHEMHHERAERPLVHYLNVDGAHRAAMRDQRFGNRALLGGNEVARRMAREVVGARELGEVGRETRPAAFAGFADDGYEVLRRAVEIEL